MIDNPYRFIELDHETRRHMLAELDLDIASNGSPFMGKDTLTDRGRRDYTDLLRTAIEEGDEVTFVAALSAFGRAVESPLDAARRLGRTEFNRYYIRGICQRANAHGTNVVVVYRAHGSEVVRPGSVSLVDQELSSPRILANIRGTQGGDPDTGLGRVNSGLTVRCGCTSCLRIPL